MPAMRKHGSGSIVNIVLVVAVGPVRGREHAIERGEQLKGQRIVLVGAIEADVGNAIGNAQGHELSHGGEIVVTNAPNYHTTIRSELAPAPDAGGGGCADRADRRRVLLPPRSVWVNRG